MTLRYMTGHAMIICDFPIACRPDFASSQDLPPRATLWTSHRVISDQARCITAHMLLHSRCISARRWTLHRPLTIIRAGSAHPVAILPLHQYSRPRPVRLPPSYLVARLALHHLGSVTRLSLRGLGPVGIVAPRASTSSSPTMFPLQTVLFTPQHVNLSSGSAPVDDIG